MYRSLQNVVDDFDSVLFQSPAFRLVNVMGPRDNLTIYKGSQTAFYADMKLPLGSYYPDIKILVTAPHDNSTTPHKVQLYLCSVRIKHMGDNMACNQESREATLTPTFNPTKEKLADMAALNLTHIANVGFHDFGGKICLTYNCSGVILIHLSYI